MRQQHDPRVAYQPRMDRWLLLVDVQPRGRDRPAVERGHEGGFVDDGAARGVDDGGGGLHLGELGGGEEVVR